MARPEMRPVTSTNLSAVGYDEQKRELYIQFQNSGSTYVYADVDQTEYRNLMGARSLGVFFWRNIRDRPFRIE